MLYRRVLAPFGAAAIVIGTMAAPTFAGTPSAAREWNEVLLEAIRNDFARPTVHARNLFHTSVVMWDAWAAYDPLVDGYLVDEDQTAGDVEAARAEALSYASYRLLKHRFANSPGWTETETLIDATMAYDPMITTEVGDTPAALGNRIAAAMIAFGLADNSNEQNDYINQFYSPVNPALLPDFPGNPNIIDPNRWQPLALEFFIDQSGNPIPFGFPEFLSPEWGQVTPFALTADDLTVNNRDGFDYWVYHDPGPPPLLGGVGDAYYRWGTEQVVIWSSHLDPSDGVMMDASPASIGNAALPGAGDYEAYYDKLNGGDWGTGYKLNPVTGVPYTPQMVPRGDYGRILAEFWADGPDSETPPGHWFTLLNYVSDQTAVKQLGGEGPVISDLEWDVKCYLAMGGAMHDVAIASWGVKGWYDYIRPISAIRYLADQGTLGLEPGLIELVTLKTTAPGERHELLAGEEGKIAVYAWRGPDYIENPDTDEAGVGWILAENWWPYQRPTFVTPPFAGYVSGHSTYSRAAAHIMTFLTGSPYFPGGLGEFTCPVNDFLVFEEGPSMSVTLQWASYFDASDQCSLSRIWGGIHPGADDIPGRQMGEVIGPESFDLAELYYLGVADNRYDISGNDDVVGFGDLTALLALWGQDARIADFDENGSVGFPDLTSLLGNWSTP